MATSNVKNAMGVLQQFSKQPVSTYVRNLINVNTSTGAAEGQINRAQQLMTALSSVGDNLLAYGVGQEERKRTIADRANNLVNAATEEDWNKRSAIEILNQDSMSSQLIDNPYAIAIIEQGRGKYQNSKMNLAYQDVVNEQGRAKTVGEEIKRYEQFSHDWYKEHVGESYNDVSFNKGFYKDYNEDLNNQATSTALSISNDLKVQRDGMMQADIGGAVESVQKGKLTATDTVPHMSQLFSSATVAAMTLPDKIKLAKGYLESLAKIGVDDSFLEEAKKIQIATLPDGQALLLGNVIDVHDYSESNMVAIRQNKMLDYTDWEMKLLKCNSQADIEKVVSQMDEDAQQYMHLAIENRKVAIVKEEEAARKRRLLSNIKQKSSQLGSNTFMNVCEKVLNGQRIAKTLGEIMINDVDSSGNIIKRALTKSEAAEGLYAYIANLRQDPNLSDDEKTSRVTRLLANPVINSVSGDIQSMFEDDLASLDPNDSPDSPTMSGARMLVNMINNDPANAQRALSADLFKEAYALKNLTDLKGDFNKAAIAYATCRPKLRDPEARKVIDEQVNTALDTSIVLPIAGEGRGTESVTLNDNSSIVGLAKTALTYFIAAGYSPEEAQSKLQQDISEFYCILPDEGMAVVPKALFGGINVKDKVGVAEQYKQDKINEYADAHMVSPTSITWQWNEQDNKYQMVDLNIPSVVASYGISEFGDEVTYWAAEAQEEYDAENAEKEERQEQAQESYELAKNFTDDYIENSGTIMD